MFPPSNDPADQLFHRHVTNSGQWDPWSSPSGVGLGPPPIANKQQQPAGSSAHRIRRSNSLTPPSNAMASYPQDPWSLSQVADFIIFQSNQENKKIDFLNNRMTESTNRDRCLYRRPAPIRSLPAFHIVRYHRRTRWPRRAAVADPIRFTAATNGRHLST